MFQRAAATVFLLALLCAPATASNCFWVGGTGTWDQTNSGGGGAGGIKWASATGGGTACAATSGPAAGVPGTLDTATLDGSSGGGTVTLNYGGAFTIQSLTMGAFTGTFDNSVNNNNITLTAVGTAFNGSGTGTRTFKLGTATYTMSATTGGFSISVATNLTYTGNTGANLVFSGTSTRTFNSAAFLSHGNVSVGAGAAGSFTFTGLTGYTVNSLSITAPNYIIIASNLNPLTITTATNWTGSSSSQIGFAPGTLASRPTLAIASGSVAQWVSLRELAFSGNTLVATNSFDLGDNSGATITAPSEGGGCIIGGWLLYRDLPQGGNDNFLALLDKAG